MGSRTENIQTGLKSVLEKVEVMFFRLSQGQMVMATKQTLSRLRLLIQMKSRGQLSLPFKASTEVCLRFTKMKAIRLLGYFGRL